MPEDAFRSVPLHFERLSEDQQRARLGDFHARITRRRSVRDFSDEHVPDEVMDRAIAVAGYAPSGANLQPWRFVVVRDPAVKRRSRDAAEEEERIFYEKRAPDEWLRALGPLARTGGNRFSKSLRASSCSSASTTRWPGPDGSQMQMKHYYVVESVGIACGFLLAALHTAALATVTHTPSPMGFLASILPRRRTRNPLS